MRGVVLDSREKDGTSVVLLGDGRIEVVQKYYTVGDEIELNSRAVKHRPAMYLWQRAAVAAAVILLVFGLASPRITYASVTVDGVEYGVNMYNRVISMVAVDDSEETRAFVEENKETYNKQSLDDVLDDVADKMLAENKDAMEIEVDGPAGMQERMKERADEYKDRFEQKKKAETNMAGSGNDAGQTAPHADGNAGSQGGSAAPNTAGSAAGSGAPGADGQNPQGTNGQDPQTMNGQSAQGTNNQNTQSASDQNIQSGNGQNLQSGNGQNTQSSEGQGASVSREDNAGVNTDTNNRNPQGSADGGADENMSGRNDAGNAGADNTYDGGHETGEGRGGDPGVGEPRR